jgi:hypothetical protein
MGKFLFHRKEPQEKKTEKGVLLPLYFGWGLKIALVRLSKDALNFTSRIFKNKWQEAGVLVLVLITIGSGIFFYYYSKPMLAATYNFNQDSWTGGADVTATATHPTGQTGWDKYYSKDELISAGTELNLIITTTSEKTQTTTEDFNAGTLEDVSVEGNNVSLKYPDAIYRKQITINGTIDGVQSNYQMPIRIYRSDPPVISPAGGTITTVGENTVHTFATVGTFSFVVPAGASDNVQIEAWGAGGGGGKSSPYGQGGGGGGAYSKINTYVVTSGNYAVVVGAGGASDVAAGGGDSTFNTDIVVADGGVGATDRPGVSGGIVANCVGDVKYKGGNGATGNSNGNTGGGGGGAGGPDGEGANGNGPVNLWGGPGGAGDAGLGGSGGTTCAGCAGGAGQANVLGGGGGGGGDDNRTGGAGGAPGGGGGGGDSAGGTGGRGQIVVTYATGTLDGLDTDGTEALGTSTAGKVYIGATGCAEDYDDIRFTAADGVTQLDYWIQASDSASSTIWVEFDSIPAHPDDVTFYIYYGDDTLSAVSAVLPERYVTTNEPTWGTWGEQESRASFVSSAIDAEQESDFTTLEFTITEPTSTDLTFQLRTSDSTTTLESENWLGPDGTAGTYYATSGTDIWSGHDGDRYIQYKAYFSAIGTGAPYLSDITIDYQYYATGTYSLTGSPYDTYDAGNIIGGLSWDEVLPSDTVVTIFLRTASTSTDLAVASWSDFTKDTSDCAKVSNTVTCSLAAIPAGMKDGADDQWFQYKVSLETLNTGLVPVLQSVSVVYLVNGPPNFNSEYGTNGVSVTASTSQSIYVSYAVRDADTDAGSPSNQYKIWPSFEYSTNGGSSWSAITTSTLALGDTDEKTVATSSYNIYTAIWNAKSQLGINTYSANAMVRVTANDHEIANNTAIATSTTFALDTKNPAISIFSINGTQSPSPVIFDATDDSVLEMRISLNPDFSGASWEAYNLTSQIALTENPDTVYYEVRDVYGNSASSSATTPETPTLVMVQDTSNSFTDEKRLFISWAVVESPTPGFKQYNIYKSTDNATYALLGTTSSRATNYYSEAVDSSSTTYYYKVSTQDSNNNISYLSSAVYGIANGTQDAGEGGGGSEVTAPTISNIATSSITTNSITMTWDTNEPSNSTVGYSTTSGDFTNETGVATMRQDVSVLGQHTVVLSGLTPGATYYFQVKSADPSGNFATTTDASYFFTTFPGPTISDVTTLDISNVSAKIIWTTDMESNSFVVYSTSSNMSNSQEVGSADLTNSHSVTLSSLSQGIRYYYYVKSTDASLVTAYDKNVVDGTIQYYFLNTTEDVTGPIISNATSTASFDACTLTWTTNEISSSQLEYGLTNSYGSTTAEDMTMTIQHAITIPNLVQDGAYHFRPISKDASSNQTLGSDVSCTTLSEGTTTTITLYGGGGGGGGASDTTPPEISEVKILSISQESAIIGWKTNEEGNSLVSYGSGSNYDFLAGNHEEKIKTHRVILIGLFPSTKYRFQAVSYDRYGNAGKSSEKIFTTLAVGQEQTQETISFVEEAATTTVTGSSTEAENVIIATKSTTTEDVPEIERNIVEKAMDMIKGLGSSYSLASISDTLKESIERVVSPPIISGDYPRAEVGSDWAKISWVTDKKSNSLVAYALPEEYDSSKTDPYDGVFGNKDELVTFHEITLKNLLPATTYHYQVRSTPDVGPEARGPSKTFSTLSQKSEISDIKFLSLSESAITLNWKTTFPTKSEINIYNQKTGEKKVNEDKSYLKDHELNITELIPATEYSLQISSEDEQGNKSNSSILPFTTTISLEPPQVSQVRINTSLVQGKTEKIQAVISWKTDKPATSRMFYEKGISQNKELALSTPLNSDLVSDHVLITTVFEPGQVYRFRVESIDAFDNASYSRDFTILTPSPKESVLDLIVKNFEDTFNFLNQVKF